MCIVSMVHDHYNPIIPDITTPWVPAPVTPSPLPGTIPSTWITFNPQIPDPQIEELKELTKAFREDLKKAMELDIRLKQPDCLDPAKAGLEDRVAKLEAYIATLEADKKKSKPKSKKKRKTTKRA